MGLKGTKLYSVFTMTCPKCQETKIFKNGNPYNFSKIFDMPERCEKCGQKIEVEPGFFYGSMYVSYGVSVAYLVAVWVAMMVLYPSFTTTEYLLVAITTLIILTPYFFRLSRSVWINFFVNYDPDAIQKWEKEKHEVLSAEKAKNQ
ncbi:MAG: DUF983 domain-containing protein [Crocinitomicaceae bacterium]|nr:DUF983 domain-containing protein [Crocinitomicaceae bacterium]|tara:strand:- start:6746 stop:7183 length:438 start_codon:yes stop_codon:yes gene_type:complete